MFLHALDTLAREGEASRAGTKRTRFPCLPSRVINDPPALVLSDDNTKMTPYEKMVDPKWAAAHPKFRATPNNPDWNIFNFEFTDEMLDGVYRTFAHDELYDADTE